MNQDLTNKLEVSELIDEILFGNKGIGGLSKEDTTSIMKHLHKIGKVPQLSKEIIDYIRDKGYRWREQFGDAYNVLDAYPYSNLYFDCLARFHEIKRPEMEERYRTTIDMELSHEKLAMGVK